MSTPLFVPIDAVLPILLRECYRFLEKKRKNEAQAVFASIVRLVQRYMPSRDTLESIYELAAGFPECAPELTVLIKRTVDPKQKAMFESYQRSLEVCLATIKRHERAHRTVSK